MAPRRERTRTRARERARRDAAPARDARPADAGSVARVATLRGYGGAATAAVLAITVVAVYAQLWNAEFLNFDDTVYVTQNAWVRQGLSWGGVVWAFTSTELSNWHPLTWLSHMLDVAIFGMHAGGHHLTNVVLHAVNGVLLFAVLRAMTRAPGRSAIVAFLFALHPLHVESVAWVAERKDVLSTTFLFLALAAYQRYARTPSLPRYLLVAGAFAAGLLAKPMLVTLPFLLLLLDVWPLRRLAGSAGTPAAYPTRDLRALVLEKVPLVLMSGIASAVTFGAQQGAGAVGSAAAYPFGARLANAALAYVRYARRMVWPSDLAVFYPYDRDPSLAVVAAAVLVLSAISVAVLRARRDRPELLVGWLWYLGMLVPVIGLVQVGQQALADRYTYVPLVGLFVAVVWGLGDLVERYRVAPAARNAALAVLAVACVGLTARQVSYWRDSGTLFTHALAVTTDNYLANVQLGAHLSEQGRYGEAAARYEDALRAKRDYPEAHNDLAYALDQSGDREGALRHYAEALRMAPHYADAHYNRGLLLQRAGDLEGATADYRAAIAVRPSYVEAHNNLGLVLRQQRDLEGARTHLATAVRLRPDHLASRINLGVVLRATGDLDGAVAQYEAAIRIDAGSADAHYNLANALAERRDLDAAVTHYREALRIKPDYDAARDMLQLALDHQRN